MVQTFLSAHCLTSDDYFRDVLCMHTFESLQDNAEPTLNLVTLLQGACEDGPSASMLAKLRYATPPDVMPGQCLLITEGGIMRLKDAAMMLANLFIAIVPADENRHLENPALDILDSTGWAENVTVDGQNIKTCKDSCGIRVRTATVTIVGASLWSVFKR